MPRLAAFIRANTEAILSEWETFARALPMGEAMDIAALRDHAKEMLEVIATDLGQPQTRGESAAKSKGESDADQRVQPTAAGEHGAGRAEVGFTVSEMVAEFRALRASVVRLWTRERHQLDEGDLVDLVRFNEAIDQAIAESILRHTHDIDQSKERFLAILGHDLLTPVGAIITSSAFMLDTRELAEPHLSLVTRIESSARRMNQMVVDLLDFTRTRFGDSIPVVRAAMDARKLINDVVAEVGATYPNSIIRIETSGNLRGEWDSDRLMQAMTNLVANAVQHGSDNAPIQVAAKGAEHEVTIAIHNEGPPIPETELSNIFNSMKGASAHGSRDRRHLGLGLYIVDRIVKAHDGRIDVQSSQEEGTTFVVHLPR
jgi:signal transduction histidine kinase